MSQVWISKRKGKKGIAYNVRWYEPGTDKAKSKAFKRAKDAESYKVQLRNDIDNGNYHRPVKMRFSDWKEKHISNMENSPDVEVSEKTISSHAEALTALEAHCKPRYLSDITPALMRKFRQTLLEQGHYSKSTINKFLRTIRSALSYAVRDEFIQANKLLGPLRLLLKVAHKLPRILEVGEVTTLFNAVKDLRHKVVIALAYYHGMRRKEMCFLKWVDIDFMEQKICVMDRQDAHTKKRVSRIIAMREEAADLLRQLQVLAVNEYVFERPQAFYWQCGKWFDALVKESGIDFCTLHDLRKTCNTLMKEGGTSTEAAMQVLGHSSHSVNMDVYTGVLSQQQRDAVNSLPKIG